MTTQTSEPLSARNRHPGKRSPGTRPGLCLPNEC
jgi:hypothetical protein